MLVPPTVVQTLYTFQCGLHILTIVMQCHYKALQGAQDSGISEHPLSSAGMSQHKVKSVVIAKCKQICRWLVSSRIASLKFQWNGLKELC